MKLHTNFENILVDYGLLIGNFDGVHVGHRNLIHKFVQRCRQDKLSPVILTFDPHPKFYFSPETTDFKITDKKRRFDLLFQCSIDHLVQMKFDENIQQLEAEDFLTSFIFNQEKLKYLAIGHDFAMGAGKEDSRDIVKRLCQKNQVALTEQESFVVDEEVVSSSLIRKLIKRGEVNKANKLLKRDFTISGKVVKGAGIGKKKLFPTVNTEYASSQLLPQNGVYLTWIEHNGKWYCSTTNVGVRPTVAKDDIRKLETFIFDFDQDAYGDMVSITFVKRLRDEIKFDGIEALKSQIERDIEQARKFFQATDRIHLALVGKNISHSMSKNVYEKLLSGSVNYDLLDYKHVSDIQRAADLSSLYSGVSITAPYKRHFVNELEIEGDYKEVINCFQSHKGINTDFLACQDILSRIKAEFEFERVIILGDGDMSKMLQIILAKRDETYQILSRRQNNLDQISQAIDASELDTLVINSCSREYKPSIISDKAFFFWDLNYNVDYEAQIRRNPNCIFEDGKELLELQAKYALNFWNLKTP